MTRRDSMIARLRGERGVVAVIVAISMIVLMGAAALALDLGYTYVQKRRLQAAVDFALLAGAQKLPDSNSAKSDAQSFLNANWTNNGNSTPPSVQTLTTCKFDPANPQQCTPNSTPCDANSPCQMRLNATAKVPTFFGNIFGVNNINVSAQASACGGCETTTQKFDVVVVLDRSFSMCLDANGNWNYSNGQFICQSLNDAETGIKGLLTFFNPATDRLGLAVVSSGDNVTPFDGTGAYPCDGANQVRDYGGGHPDFYRSFGDFMDGTASSHNSWLIAPLANDFKNADGSINNNSAFVSDLNCLQPKFWTPIAPAVQAAATELTNNPRPGARKVIIYMGDGGANVQPMQRDANGNATATPSWYTPTAGNDLMPCHDAVGQAALAKQQGIEVFTIAYNLNAGTADTCYANNKPLNSSNIEPGLDARLTLQQMASDANHFYEKQTPGQVLSIFQSIGHLIVSGGTRITS